jgi:hypothetical protein
MSIGASRFMARVRSLSLTFWAFPVFMILTLVPWLLATHAFVLSRQFYTAGRDFLGAAFTIGAIAIAGFTALGTVWFCAVWLMMLVRCIRGSETRE